MMGRARTSQNLSKIWQDLPPSVRLVIAKWLTRVEELMWKLHPGTGDQTVVLQSSKTAEQYKSLTKKADILPSRWEGISIW